MAYIWLNAYSDIPVVGEHAGGVGGLYPPWMYYFDNVYRHAQVYVGKGTIYQIGKLYGDNYLSELL